MTEYIVNEDDLHFVQSDGHLFASANDCYPADYAELGLREVVHCGDCRHAHVFRFDADVVGDDVEIVQFVCEHPQWKDFWDTGSDVDPTSFCSHGERRDAE